MRACALVVLALLVSGCGFHLRGDAQLPEGTASIYLKAPSNALEDEFSIYLLSAGAVLMPTKAGADTILHLSDEHFEKRTLSVDQKTGKEREFEITYSVSFNLRRADGEVLVAPQQVALQRDYVFDPDQVIGKSREEGVLRSEMRRDAVQQVLRRIEASVAQ